MLKSLKVIGFLVVAAAVPSYAQAQTCTNVSGRLFERVLPNNAAPNDQLGRVLGVVSGSLVGAKTAIITSDPRRNPISTIDTFGSDRGLIVLNGSAVFTPMGVAPGGPVVLYDDLNMTVSLGTGEFLGATGSIRATGFGIDVSPGQGQFILEYSGRICVPTK